MRGVLSGLLTIAGRGCVAALALALVLHGSTKRPPVRRTAAPAPPDVTDADVARGYRLVSVATNAAPPYARPAGAAVHRPWGLRGASVGVEVAALSPPGESGYAVEWMTARRRLRIADKSETQLASLKLDRMDRKATMN